VRYNKNTDLEISTENKSFYITHDVIRIQTFLHHLTHYNTLNVQAKSQTYDRKEVQIDESMLDLPDYDGFDDVASSTQYEDLAEATCLTSNRNMTYVPI